MKKQDKTRQDNSRQGNTSKTTQQDKEHIKGSSTFRYKKEL
jgi:hypothetical protein